MIKVADSSEDPEFLIVRAVYIYLKRGAFWLFGHFKKAVSVLLISVIASGITSCSLGYKWGKNRAEKQIKRERIIKHWNIKNLLKQQHNK